LRKCSFRIHSRVFVAINVQVCSRVVQTSRLWQFRTMTGSCSSCRTFSLSSFRIASLSACFLAVAFKARTCSFSVRHTAKDDDDTMFREICWDWHRRAHAFRTFQTKFPRQLSFDRKFISSSNAVYVSSR